MVVSNPLHSHPTHSFGQASYSFRCPSCLNVLTVDSRLSSTAAPCPLCGAHIIAPKPILHGIPFATIAGSPSPQFTASSPVSSVPYQSSSSPGKIVLVDGGISQSHLNRKDTMTTVKMVVFSILTAGICLAAAWLLLSR